MSISSLGIGSGLNIRQIVDDLVAAERAPAENRIGRQEQRLETEISALGQVQSLMSDFVTTVAGLQNPDSFVSQDTSSSSDAVGISANSGAEDGSWAVDVQQLAEAQRSVLRVDDIEDRDEPLGTGEITIQSADRTTTITIDEDNQTLEGIRDAINDSTADIQASIINDGNGQRLVLSGQEEGANGAFTMDVDGDLGDRLDPGDGGGLLDELQAAQDAEFTVDGLAITRSSNDVSDVLDGITLNLEAVTESAATVSVTTDSSTIQSQVESFVDAFNAFQGGIAELTDFDPETGESGPLNGESSVTGIVSQLRSAITAPVDALEGRAVRAMADIGILTTRSGALELDASRLDDAVREDPEAVTALFAETGIAEGKGFEFDGASSATQPGSYPVDITQVATRGTLAFGDGGDGTGGFDLTGGDNDFRVEIDGVRSDMLSLPAEYFESGDELARAIQAAINGDDQINDGGAGVSVAFEDGVGFTMTSDAFGSDSTVEVVDAGADIENVLGMMAGTAEAGLDVEGTIGGVQADGAGQILTAGSGAPEGLQVRVDGDQTGNIGTLTFSSGLMADLENRIDALIGPQGSLNSRTDSLNNRLSGLDDDRARLDDRMARVEDRYIKQFTAMDRMVAELQQTSQFLSQQLPQGGMSGVSV